jgi:heme-binding protein
MFKKILLVVLVLLIIIQFIHPSRNISEGEQPNNIAHAFNVPTEVKTILDKACVDCHSNNTRYPWYFKIQPLDWWLTHHITEGKRELNFDEYTNKPLRYQYHKMESTVDQIKKDEMPLNSYLWMHKEAILTEPEKNVLINWAQEITNEMKAKYPADSLVRKKK